MKPVRTNETNVTLTLPGGNEDNELPAVRAMLMDSSRNQTERDASLGFVTTWQPDDAEARALEAGACIEVSIWGPGHPPIAVSVTQGLVPEREMIARGIVDRAMGVLYADLRERMAEAIDTHGVSVLGMNTTEDAGLPDPSAFADMWSGAVKAVLDDDARQARASDLGRQVNEALDQLAPGIVLPNQRTDT
jgi:hypothetical protein